MKKFFVLFLLIALLKMNFAETSPDDVCFLPLETGPCRAAIKKYGFDSTEGKCREFSYGGCQGNGNRFSTKEECEDRC